MKDIKFNVKLRGGGNVMKNLLKNIKCNIRFGGGGGKTINKECNAEFLVTFYPSYPRT